MTDERQGEGLWASLERLPAGAGVVFRHYRLGPEERHQLFLEVRRLCRERRLILLAAGSALPPADGVHGRRGAGLRSASAHNLWEIRVAERQGADLIFLSPVFPTRSHPSARTLGPDRFALLARQASVPVIALGGMDSCAFARLRGAHGWGGIDAWL
jgi:thiamine-phosphate pyrophosphorylase